MSLNNVNQDADLQNFLKFMNGNKKSISPTKKVDINMTMNGSIFNSKSNIISSTGNLHQANPKPEPAKGNSNLNNILNANTAKAISNVSPNEANKNIFSGGNYDFTKPSEEKSQVLKKVQVAPDKKIRTLSRAARAYRNSADTTQEVGNSNLTGIGSVIQHVGSQISSGYNYETQPKKTPYGRIGKT